MQERMTRQVAEAVMTSVGARGVIVMVEAEHMCMSMRGARKPGASTTTLVRLGVCDERGEEEGKGEEGECARDEEKEDIMLSRSSARTHGAGVDVIAVLNTHNTTFQRSFCKAKKKRKKCMKGMIYL